MARQAEELKNMPPIPAPVPIPEPPKPDPAEEAALRKKEAAEMKRMRAASTARQREMKTHAKETTRLKDATKKMEHNEFEHNWKGFVSKENKKVDDSKFQYLGPMNLTVDSKIRHAKQVADDKAAREAAEAKRIADIEAAR